MKGVWVREIFGNSVVVVSARHHNKSRNNRININCLSKHVTGKYKQYRLSGRRCGWRDKWRRVSTAVVEGGGHVPTQPLQVDFLSENDPQSHVAFSRFASLLLLAKRFDYHLAQVCCGGGPLVPARGSVAALRKTTRKKATVNPNAVVEVCCCWVHL